MAVESCEARSLLSGASGSLTFAGTPQAEQATVQFRCQPLLLNVGDYEATLNGAAVKTVVYCVNLDKGVSPNQTYGVHTGSTAALPNGGQIAYLVNRESAAISALLSGPPSQTARDESAGLQLAIWKLEYGPDFQVLSAGAGATQYATRYLAEAQGQSDTATYIVPDESDDPDDGQGFVVAGQNYTQGFWKNHPDAWPVQSLTIAGATFSKDTLINILQTPPKKGDAALILVHQLIAAELNIINGVLPSAAVASATIEANKLLTPVSTGGKPTGFLYVSSGGTTGQRMTTLANLLDSFNSANGG